MIKLDYTIESPEERKAYVEKIFAETPDPSPQYLEILADYLVLCMEKQEKKEKKILTDNRLTTVNKREASFEGLAAQLESGEDGLYSMMTADRNTIFAPKISITQQDLEEIPLLRQLKDTITMWEQAAKKAIGTRDAYVMKKALIEMRKDQYLIKQAYRKPIIPIKLTRSDHSFIALDDKSHLDGQCLTIDGVSLMNPKVVNALLENYSRLREDSWDIFRGDTRYLMDALEEIADKALAEQPMLMRILEMKIDKLQNIEIQSTLQSEFAATYTPEYISALWQNKIPKLIAQEAQKDYIMWQYKTRGWPMKKCSRCGQIKPAHNAFFSKNNTSRDGWYSLCKSCRSKAQSKRKEV